MNQSFSKAGLEFLQGAAFCDFSFEFITVPGGTWEERVEINVTVDYLLERRSLASDSAIMQNPISLRNDPRSQLDLLKEIQPSSGSPVLFIVAHIVCGRFCVRHLFLCNTL